MADFFQREIRPPEQYREFQSIDSWVKFQRARKEEEERFRSLREDKRDYGKPGYEKRPEVVGGGLTGKIKVKKSEQEWKWVKTVEDTVRAMEEKTRVVGIGNHVRDEVVKYLESGADAGQVLKAVETLGNEVKSGSKSGNDLEGNLWV